MHPQTTLASGATSQMNELSDLMLSASFDWSIKLWYPKVRTDPLLTLESAQEYIYDVQWSPVHPACFASCDGDGGLDLWNLNANHEASLSRKKIGSAPLNSLRWSVDGKRIATGDSEGGLSIFALDKDIYNPKEDEVQKMCRRFLTQTSHKEEEAAEEEPKEEVGPEEMAA
jgi:dynein intermediate chain